MAYCGGGGGGGGGGGAAGGGAISLVARNSILIQGVIAANGDAYAGDAVAGQTSTAWQGGAGGRGGISYHAGTRNYGAWGEGNESCLNPGCRAGRGTRGGLGAGGGVLLKCDGPFGITVTGTINTAGGGGTSATNFGSTKFFGVRGRIGLSGANLLTGWNDSYGNPLQTENQMWIHPCC